jgi:hypothetical protein
MTKAKVLLLAVLLIFLAIPAFAAEKANIGPNLPPFTLEAPTSAEGSTWGFRRWNPSACRRFRARWSSLRS